MGEEGRGTDGEEIFGERCQRDIGDILGVLNDERFESFWISLRTNCLKIRRGIETTPNSFKIAPFEATLSQRLQWLQANVLNPIEKLKRAIAAENHPYFNHWETYGEVEVPDTVNLQAELGRLGHLASEVADQLDGERTGDGSSGRLSHNDEIRHYIVFTALEEVREHFPEIKLVRGNWDKGVRNMTGIVPDYVRRVFLETTGQNETLNGQLQTAISAL